jgi:hypothetical protein
MTEQKITEQECKAKFEQASFDDCVNDVILLCIERDYKTHGDAIKMLKAAIAFLEKKVSAS